MSKRLFNYDLPPNTLSTTSIIEGKTSGIMNLNKCSYPVFVNIFNHMEACTWFPSHVNMKQDGKDYPKLLPSEKYLYDSTLSQLIFMDSVQTNNSSDNVNGWITDPMANATIVRQASEEATHSKSYAVMVDSISENKDEIYDMWKTNPILKRKNEFIGEVYHTHGKLANEDTSELQYRCKLEYELFTIGAINVLSERPENLEILSICTSLTEYTQRNFRRRFVARIAMIVANQLLEGIYFYAGFMCIFALGRMNKMIGSSQMIKYIMRDEKNHLAIYRNLFRIIRIENSQEFDAELLAIIKDMFIKAVELEIEWGHSISNNQIMGIKNDDITKYIQFLANDRITALGLEKDIGLLYPEVGLTDPYPWVEKFSKLNDTKTDFFQGTVLNYSNEALSSDGDSDEDDI